MQPASFPTHPNKEHVIEALYTGKQEYHTPNHIHPYLGTFNIVTMWCMTINQVTFEFWSLLDSYSCPSFMKIVVTDLC